MRHSTVVTIFDTHSTYFVQIYNGVGEIYAVRGTHPAGNKALISRRENLPPVALDEIGLFDTGDVAPGSFKTFIDFSFEETNELDDYSTSHCVLVG